MHKKFGFGTLYLLSDFINFSAENLICSLLYSNISIDFGAISC